MNPTIVRPRAQGVFLGTGCLLLAVLVAACSRETAPPKPAATVAARPQTQPPTSEAAAEPGAGYRERPGQSRRRGRHDRRGHLL
jgi:hypothetical protein